MAPWFRIPLPPPLRFCRPLARKQNEKKCLLFYEKRSRTSRFRAKVISIEWRSSLQVKVIPTSLPSPPSQFPPPLVSWALCTLLFGGSSGSVGCFWCSCSWLDSTWEAEFLLSSLCLETQPGLCPPRHTILVYLERGRVRGWGTKWNSR